MERNPTKEDHEERHPFEVLEKSSKKGGFSNTVAHNGEADVREPVENNKQDDEDYLGLACCRASESSLSRLLFHDST